MSQGMDIDDILQEFEQSSGQILQTGEKTGEKSRFVSQESIYHGLVQAMINERMSPELLPYKKELLAHVLAQLSMQQQYLLEYHEYGDTNSDTGVLGGDFKLQLMIIETEIERLNYLVRLYLRTRLSKIDNFTIHYINILAEETPDTKSLLSKQEIEYMHQHFKILTQLYNSCFLKKMPKSLTLLDDTSGGQLMITTPDLNEPVFIRYISKNPVTIPMNDQEELELVKNGIYVVKYSLIKAYLQLGDVELI